MTTTRLLRRREVEELVSLGRSSLYRHIERGTFPRPIVLGPRCVRWREDEIREWLESLPHTDAVGADSC